MVDTVRETSQSRATSTNATPRAGATPITSPGETVEQAAAQVDLRGLLASLNADTQAVRPASGSFETAEDIEGALLAGPPDARVERVERVPAEAAELPAGQGVEIAEDG